MYFSFLLNPSFIFSLRSIGRENTLLGSLAVPLKVSQALYRVEGYLWLPLSGLSSPSNLEKRAQPAMLTAVLPWRVMYKCITNRRWSLPHPGQGGCAGPRVIKIQIKLQGNWIGSQRKHTSTCSYGLFCTIYHKNHYWSHHKDLSYVPKGPCWLRVDSKICSTSSLGDT